jgi:maltokinase
MAELTMTSEAALAVVADSSGWRYELRPSPAPVGENAGVGPTRWLVEQLAEGNKTALTSGFQLHRFSRALTSPAPGERPVTTDQTNRSVVVGDQVVVKWLARVDDVEYPAVRALRHLDEVGFAGVPATFGALTWRSPSERELPCAFVTGYLPEAVDGWQWCVEALESGERAGFPAELGSLAAKLHVALGSPSSLMPLPMSAVGAAAIQNWHAQARLRLDELTEQIGVLDGAPAGQAGAPARLVPSDVLAGCRERMESEIDRLLDVRGRTPVQLIHGDLHVGQVLRWAGGLSVIDFDGGPMLGATAARQPAARDVAQLLLSLDHVGRVVDCRSGFTRTDEINAWSAMARAEFLTAYRAELEEVERRDVLDARLLPSLLVEQAGRDLLYAIQFLPRWAYATVEGLETILNDLPVPPPEQAARDGIAPG